MENQKEIYNDTLISENTTDENIRYELTPWGCLFCVLEDYGFDAQKLSSTVGNHMVSDFLEMLCKIGYIKKNDD